MPRLVLDPDLEPMLTQVRVRGERRLFTALLQIQSSRQGYCGRADCGHCPLGVSGCISGERDLRAERFFALHYPVEQVA